MNYKAITKTELDTYYLLKFLIQWQNDSHLQRFRFRVDPVEGTVFGKYTVPQILMSKQLKTDFSLEEQWAYLITLLEMLYWEDVITYTEVHCPDGYKHPKDIFTLTEDVQNRGAAGVLPEYITIVLRFKAFDLYRELGKKIAPPITSDTITFNDKPEDVTNTETITAARKAAANAREQAERCLREAEKLNAQLYPWHDEGYK